MDAIEATDVIEPMTHALVENPSQFHINVSIVGKQVTSHRGIGLSVTATGGGSGSSTIGQLAKSGVYHCILHR